MDKKRHIAAITDKYDFGILGIDNDITAPGCFLCLFATVIAGEILKILTREYKDRR